MGTKEIKSGLVSLDEMLNGFREGDNVVWQVDSLDEYTFFTEPFVKEALLDSENCVYLRFAPHPPIVSPRKGLIMKKVDPGRGFTYFVTEIHRIIREQVEARTKYFIFDNLSALVDQWATDELLANFFQVTCPFLGELDTVAYFALTRGRHANSAVARIRDTTQVLIDVYRINEVIYVHPLKVWDRYSPQMFLPHIVTEEKLQPVFQSGEAAEVSSVARKKSRSEKTSIAPWDSVYKKILQYRDSGETSTTVATELQALKHELARMLIGSHEEFNKLSETYFTLGDLLGIRDRMIGSGRIGGKAAGMLLARRILLDVPGEIDFSKVLEHHDSFYIGSDVFFTFLVDNDFFRLRLQLSKNFSLTQQEYQKVEQDFLAGSFPPDINEQFRSMLDYFGQAPIIIRSSSLLEDSFGNAFAGKYRSIFCANQGGPEERLNAFLRAVKLVYASALSPDVLSYRLKRGLGESDEQMAILVQRVSGMPYRHFFFPNLAGVAFSRNLYAWTDKIDSKQGIIRLVFGLGTRAVNRVSDDYPRMIAVSSPQLRPEVGVEKEKYSQHKVDLLDLKENLFTTLPLTEVISKEGYPNSQLLFSFMKDGYLFDPPFTDLVETGSAGKPVLTFNRLLSRTPFVKVMGEMVGKLESAYGHPVDTEFTAFVNSRGNLKVNLLQCRPLRLPGLSGPLVFPEQNQGQQILFKSMKVINGGLIGKIKYIIYIDPRRYAVISSASLKRSVGRIVGALNKHPHLVDGQFLMMGPGRWGSSNIDLGVNVSYADIDNTAVLVEIAREASGHVPEVSYGTHFFQDLVEGQIIYLPVYPELLETAFNHNFFDDSPNSLTELLPGNERFQSVVHVINIPAVTNGKYAKVVADPQTQKAVCFLE